MSCEIGTREGGERRANAPYPVDEGLAMQVVQNRLAHRVRPEQARRRGDPLWRQLGRRRGRQRGVPAVLHGDPDIDILMMTLIKCFLETRPVGLVYACLTAYPTYGLRNSPVENGGVFVYASCVMHRQGGTKLSEVETLVLERNRCNAWTTARGPAATDCVSQPSM